MPKLTAPQLLWTGVGVLALGILGGWIGQALLVELFYRATWMYGFASTLGYALTTVGAAMIGGAFVLAALQRGSAPAAPRPVPQAPYPGAAPQAPYAPAAPQAPQAQPYAAYPAGGYPAPSVSPYAPGAATPAPGATAPAQGAAPTTPDAAPEPPTR